MKTQLNFNPDLALKEHRSKEHKNPKSLEECIPKKLKINRIYTFLAEGQQNYWLKGKVCLVAIDGNENLSKPLAKVTILEYKHFTDTDEKIKTKGVYTVNEIFNAK